MTRRLLASAALALPLCMAVPNAAWAAFDIQIVYSGDPAYQSYFTNAASTWESLLSGYQNGVVVNRSAGSSYAIGQTVTTVTINASVTAIDGAGGVLGQAGPTEVVIDGASYMLATDGIMEFDSADVASMVSGGSFQAVITHELAHVLGFGTLWTYNGVYNDGTGEYTGAAATAAWHSEFGQTGTPDVELGGGSGTADGHWNEVDGGVALTGIVDSNGNDMANELMTGWLNSPTFISNMTVQSFVDIGFLAAVPEPASYGLMAVGTLLLAWRRRRASRTAG